MRLFGEIGAHGPGQKEQSRSDFQYGARPILDGAVRDYGKDNERADAHAEELHGLERSADSGTKATSSIQAEPRILLSNFSLRKTGHAKLHSWTSLPDVQGRLS